MSSLLQDLRHGLRLFQRQPSLWILAVATLSLGTGVNSTLLSFSRALRQGLELFDLDRTVLVSAYHPELGRGRVTADDLTDLERHSRTLRQWFVHEEAFANLSGDGGAEALRVAYTRISPRYLDAIGARTALGRGFLAADFEPSRPRVALLTYGFWQTRYGGASNVVGRRLQLDGLDYEIVGVANRESWFPTLHAKLWVPRRDSDAANPTARNLYAFALLAPGVTRDQAREEFTALSRRLEQARPETNARWTYVPQDLEAGLVSSNDRTAVFLIRILGAGVLLIACANVANLLLVHAIGRRREFAIRHALGGGSLRIVRQLIAESIWLALPATILGLVLANFSAEWAFRAISPRAGVPVPSHMLDLPALALSLAIALACLVLFNLPAAWQARRLDLTAAMRDGDARAGLQSTQSRWLARSFVVLQFSLALALVITAGIVTRGTLAFHHLDVGYPTSGLIAVSAHPSPLRYSSPALAQSYFERGLEQLRALPHVAAVGLISAIPQLDGNGIAALFATEADRALPADRQRRGSLFLAGDGALEALGVPLRSGRLFHRADSARTEPVALVNEEAVRQLNLRSPLGERVCLSGNSTVQGCFTVVGVLANIKPANLAQPPRPAFFLSLTQNPLRDQQWLLRARGDSAAALAALRPQLRQLDSQQPLEFRIIAEENYREQEGSRLFSLIVSVMGALALFLSAVGLYCLMAYQVTQQRREWGIRLALGASRRHIERSVATAGLRLLLIGAVPGFAAAFFIARMLSGLLPPGLAFDPLTWVAAPLGLLVTGLLAAWAPALRAGRVDPMTALREE